MFNRNHRTECARVKENLSLYLDEQLEPVERDSITFHAETCRECKQELESLRMTRSLLHRMPAAMVPRSFRLVEAPARRSWFSFEMPAISLENSLRMATAAAVILFALVITLDLSGMLSEETSTVDNMVSEAGATDVETAILTPAPSPAPDTEPVIISTDIRDHEATQPDGPEWDTRNPIAAQDIPEVPVDTSGNNIPEQTGDLNPNGESGVFSPTPRSVTPSWVLPMEIAAGVLVLLLLALLTLQKKRVASI